jgi:nucleotide-binding universal stress UspA family protein
MRTYLVIIDETEEAEIALRFAARRAAKTKGGLEILVIIPPQEFVAWGAVQATIENEAREHAGEIVRHAIDTLAQESPITPKISVKTGDAVMAIRDALADNPDIGALVLAAAKSGNPGPLVSHFAGADSGTLPCPVMIVPGSLSNDALDRLS